MADYALMGPKWGPTSQYGTTGGTIIWSFATNNYYGQPYQWDYRISDSAQQDAIRRAFAAWEAVCNIDFVEVADSSTVDVRLGWDYIDGSYGTLGECLTSWTGNTITDADIRFDTSENWSVGGKSLYVVAVHEIGHALGLEHFDGAPVIMNTYYGVSALQPGDIEGIRTLYGYTRTSYVGTAANEKFDLHTLTYVLTISGGSGDDFLWSGSADDRLFGNAGRDIIVGNLGSDVICGENDATSTSGSNDQLLGGYGNDVIYGGGGNDYIHGEWDNDTLNGGAGSDLIYGGFGADTLNGGDGNDVLWGATAGTLQGSWFGTAIHLARNGVTGAAISENWTIAGEVQASDASNDKLAGGAGSDVLNGNAGNDWLDGGTGADNMRGGAGSDTYVVNDAGDIVNESLSGSNGSDTVRSSINFSLANTSRSLGAVENLVLVGSVAVFGTGNGLSNRIYGSSISNVLDGAGGNDFLSGGAGNDTLIGGTGADRMFGGAGNDIYRIDNTSDIVDESAAGSGGADTVQSTISFSLANTSRVLGSVENLTLLGTAALNGTGNSLANALAGNHAANVLNAGAGADTMVGEGGNDTFYVDTVGDRVFERANQGIDTVLASVSYALAAGQHIEKLTTTQIAGTAAIRFSGNELAQTIGGNNGANVIAAGGGNDVVVGYGGNDAFNGGTGNDRLYGGAGNDTLTGGTGYDHFVFNTTLNATTNVDRIIDFDVAADTIRLDNAVMAGLGTTLGTLSATMFWKSTAGIAHDADDRIIYDIDSGRLLYDSNGVAAGGAVHFATLAPNLALSNADFVVL